MKYFCSCGKGYNGTYLPRVPHFPFPPNLTLSEAYLWGSLNKATFVKPILLKFMGPMGTHDVCPAEDTKYYSI
jgi:hypothetical protein